jgi:hypothetical protein
MSEKCFICGIVHEEACPDPRENREYMTIDDLQLEEPNSWNNSRLVAAYNMGFTDGYRRGVKDEREALKKELGLVQPVVIQGIGNWVEEGDSGTIPGTLVLESTTINTSDGVGPTGGPQGPGGPGVGWSPSSPESGPEGKK